MPSGTDFSFDERVVALYNRQRAHPPAVSQQIGAAIAQRLPQAACLLEIGVGTGRIGLPVAAAGVRVVGYDLSPQMLAEIEPAAGLSPVQADMHAIPFAAASFDAALAVHVLHLARDARQVMREAIRTLKPGGLFIQGDDWIDPQSVTGRLRNELRMHAVRLDPGLMPPAAGASKAQMLAELGGTDTEEVIAAEWVTHISPAERLAQVEQRLDNESWILNDEQFAKMLLHLRQFAVKLWGDLEAQQPVTRRFVLKFTRGEWRP